MWPLFDLILMDLQKYLNNSFRAKISFRMDSSKFLERTSLGPSISSLLPSKSDDADSFS